MTLVERPEPPAAINDGREAGAYVIGTGRAADRQKALDFGAQEFVDLDNDALEDVGGVDLVFDVIGGDIQKRSASLIRAGGTLVTVVGPSEGRPADGLGSRLRCRGRSCPTG
jgi:NADPH:quinone reductase-like Zn-dependent oxidoreductase